jgi:hypothetical protein
MSARLDWLVDAFDLGIDAVRGICGFPQMPPQLVKLECDREPTVRVATGLRLETRRTFHAFLRVEQDGQVLFEGSPPKNGRVGITPLTGALMRVHAKLESRNPAARHGTTVTEAIFEPRPNGPAVAQFNAPAKVPFGEVVAVAWHAPAAQRVHLAMIEDGNVEDSIGLPSGQILVTPTRPGRLLLRLTAENSWGQTTVTKRCEIVAPKLRIDVPRTAAAGHPGDTVRFQWRVSGAESVWLIAPDAEQPQQVDAECCLFVTLGWRPAEYELLARAYGGAQRSVTLQAVPQPFACLEE